MLSRGEGVENGSTSQIVTDPKMKCLPVKTTCAFLAFTISGVAGIIIVTLGAKNIFGPVGSVGFYASLVGGGSVAVIATGGVISIAIWKCKEARDLNNSREIDGGTRVLHRSTHTKAGLDQPLDQAAFAFAREKLEENRGIAPFVFKSDDSKNTDMSQPSNQEIALLTTLFWQVHMKTFLHALQSHRDNPWSHDEVIQTADEFMKISYAISCLTLEDLESTIEDAREDDKKTYVEALTQKDSYANKTFFCVSAAYHLLRGEAAWITDPQQRLAFPAEEISEKHAQLFYTEGTIQHGWRTLYNNYCDRVREFVSDDELEQQTDQRFVRCTQKDEGSHTFVRDPDKTSS